jgi:hypothetical protein
MKNLAQTATEHNNNLIPFLGPRLYPDAPDASLVGYMDEETGEVVIEAQYYEASPFIGNFAVVNMGGRYFPYKKLKIINRNNKQIRTGFFEDAFLYASENGKTTIALLEISKEAIKIIPPGYWFWTILLGGGVAYKDTIYKQRLINLTTGETIIPEKKQLIHNHIEVVGEYFRIENKLYKFLDNGKVQCVANDENDATNAVAILNAYFEQRGINAVVEARHWGIKIDYEPYIKKMYANPDFSGAFEKLHSDFTIPFQSAHGVYRNPRKYLNTSLEISGDRKYYMIFQRENPYDHAEGVYNETRKEWEIEPYLIVSDDERYKIRNINQTNDPHVFELQLKKGPFAPSGYIFGIMVINTISGNFIRGGVINTNGSVEYYYPYYGGVYYYIDDNMD